jgi:hypothetical protein
MTRASWRPLAAAQHGAISRRQLLALGYDWTYAQRRIQSERWVERTDYVLSTTTGPATWHQRVWTGVLHAGGDAIVGGLSAPEWYGLKNWHRDEVTILVDDDLSFDAVEGIIFFRTRRPRALLCNSTLELPIARPEPAALLFAGYERSARTAQGLLAAVVQQRLTTPRHLVEELDRLRPLRRAKLFRRVLSEIEGGSQSLGEIDVIRFCRRFHLPKPRQQVRRRDSSGRFRFTDCEWLLRDGTVLILEVDGGFHMDVEHWEDDLARQRGLTRPGQTIVRCSTRELRDEPMRVFTDLVNLGL